MGRIRTMLIKRIAKKLMREHGDEVTQDYKKNKELVDKYTNVESSKIRNVLSGYTTKLAKLRDKEDAALPKKDPKSKEDLSMFY